MKSKKIISIILAVLMVFSVAPFSAFAQSSIGSTSENTSIGEDVEQQAKTEYTEVEEGSTQTEVYLTVEDSNLVVSVPTTIIVSGTPNDTGEYIGEYSVSARGDIAGDKLIIIEPEEYNIKLHQSGRNDKDAVISQEQTEFTSDDVANGKTTSGKVTSTNLLAGSWNGTANFTIYSRSINEVQNNYLSYSFNNSESGKAGGTISILDTIWDNSANYKLYWGDSSGILSDWSELNYNYTDLTSISDSGTFTINNSVLIPDDATAIYAYNVDTDTYYSLTLPENKLAIPETPNFSFASGGDYHQYENQQQNEETHKAFLTWLQAHKNDVDFCGMNGDTINSNGTDWKTQKTLFEETIANYDLPQMYYAMGDHEGYNLTWEEITVLNSLNGLSEDDEPYFSIMKNGCKFIFLGSLTAILPEEHTCADIGTGYMDYKWIGWLENEINSVDNSTPIFIFAHEDYAPYNYDANRGSSLSMPVHKRLFSALLEERSNVMWLSNDTHNALCSSISQSTLVDTEGMDAMGVGSIENVETNSNSGFTQSTSSIISVYSNRTVRTAYDLLTNKKIPLAYCVAYRGVNTSNANLLTAPYNWQQGTMSNGFLSSNEDYRDSHIYSYYIPVQPNTTYTITVNDNYMFWKYAEGGNAGCGGNWGTTGMTIVPDVYIMKNTYTFTTTADTYTVSVDICNADYTESNKTPINVADIDKVGFSIVKQ